MTRFVLLAVSTVFAASLASAQSACCQKGKEATAVAGKTESCSAEKSCCSQKNALKAPAMAYKVGDETTCCSKQASELAKGDASKIKFVVADKTYATEAEATEALTTALDDFYTTLTTVKYAVGDNCVACPSAAAELAKKENKKVGYRVATVSFETERDADAAVKAAKAAAEKVEMKIVVGDQCFTCPMSAGEVAKKEGKKVEFVVGETRTTCNKAARLNVARARVDAAIAALTPKKDEPKTASKT